MSKDDQKSIAVSVCESQTHHDSPPVDSLPKSAHCVYSLIHAFLGIIQRCKGIVDLCIHVEGIPTSVMRSFLLTTRWQCLSYLQDPLRGGMTALPRFSETRSSM